MEKEHKPCLKELKKDYEKIRSKHNLPSFREMNEDFQIEKIAECETDYLVREIRKTIFEKFSNYFRFVESLLYPMDVPIFFFSVIKFLSAEDLEKVKEIYKELSKKEIDVIELDIQYDEKKETEFVKDSFKFWQETKNELNDIIAKIKKNWDNKFEITNKGYFG